MEFRIDFGVACCGAEKAEWEGLGAHGETEENGEEVAGLHVGGSRVGDFVRSLVVVS